MSDIDNELLELEKIIINFIKTVKNYEARVNGIQDCFTKIERYTIRNQNLACWDLELESLYDSLDLLKSILYKKRKLIKHIRLYG